MAQDGKWIRWEPNAGTIQSSLDRVILYPEGFVKGFMEELMKSGGKALVQMLVNDMGKEFGTNLTEGGEFSWDDFEDALDGPVAAFDTVEGRPGAFDWDGRTRRLSYNGVLAVKLWPVGVVRSLKASANRVLTTRGAGALLGQASRKAGRMMGEMLEKTFTTDSDDTLFAAVAEIIPAVSRDLGWGSVAVSVDPGSRLIGFTIRNSFEVEAGGTDAELTIIRNQIEGFWEHLNGRAGFTSRSREFTPGNETDARLVVLALSEANREIDWNSIEWKRLVS